MQQRHSDSRQAWFLTGATGFIGRVVVARLLRRQDIRLVLLMRATAGRSAKSRLDDVIDTTALTPADRQRIDVVTGDVSEARLGLVDADYQRLQRSITHIVHMAALTAFDADLDQARRTNVDGAKHVIEFARGAHRLGVLERFGHMSTAYVVGQRRDVVDADTLCTQGPFRNPYEQSKSEGEALIRCAMADMPVTIFRPAIVVGDSQSGVAGGVSTVYWSIKAYLRGYQKIFAREDAPLDIVPVDYVADAVIELMHRPHAERQSVLLAGGQRTTVSLKTFADMMADSFKLPRVEILDPERLQRLRSVRILARLSKRHKRFLQQAQIYLPYYVDNPRFDVSKTETLLAGSGIAPPQLSEYVDNLSRYCLDQGWARKTRRDPMRWVA